MRFRSEPPPATEELPPKGAPLKRFAPGFAFNGEYTNAIDGYLEQRGARGNKDCVSNFRRRKKPSTNITVLLLQPCYSSSSCITSFTPALAPVGTELSSSTR